MTIGVPAQAGGGPALLDQSYVLGIAQGRNYTYQNGIVAKAGGTQALATQLVPGASIYNVDTVATTGDSVKLFAALPGHMVAINNNSAATLDIYTYDGYNGGTKLTSADTINGVATGTAYTLTTQQSAYFSCGLAGKWSAIKTA